jgi:DNA polymerase III subunit gamma/tau
VSAGPSLYRRHRPRTFADVVGQEHVVRTLRNAVEQRKVHHAYLFVGSRGTGKTSMAKILAACLNCEHGPTVEPCGECDSCVAIANATSLDVIEMDAASNNSVDDIRELRERVAYAPVSGRSKIYILDEAHMLSTQAWNAFLKTLEEPPPDTIFVLATTEAQKVLATVVDRCHRFDFGRPTVEQIAEVLRRAAAAEDITLSDAAVSLIARHATGSFRDALGTLEQLVTYSGKNVAIEDVLAVLGVADAELLFAALDAIADHDPGEALRVAARLSESGRDPALFFGDLESHARELLVVQTLGDVPRELSVTPDRDERLLAQAERLDRDAATRLLDLLAVGLEAMKNGADARTQLELALVKGAAPDVDASTRALLARLDRLERQLAGGDAEVVVEKAPSPAPPPVPKAGAAAAAAAAAPAPTVAVAEQPAGELGSVVELWPAVMETIRSENDLLAAALEQGRPTPTGDGLVIGFPASAAFFKRQAEKEERRAALTQAIREVTGQRVTVTFELRDDVVPEDRTMSAEELVERFKDEFDAEEIFEEEEV